MSELPELSNKQINLVKAVFCRQSIAGWTNSDKRHVVRKGIVARRFDYRNRQVVHYVPSRYLMAVQAMVEG